MGKIISMKIDNFKRIKAAEITPDGNVVTITGKNGAGKSSVLDAIKVCLCGGRSVPEKPIRDGADKGSVEIDLGDCKVIKKFTQKGNYLKITDLPEGEQAQKFLDKMVGKISFDPLEFINQTSAEQYKTVGELVGLDFTEKDAEIKRLYDERTDVNRDKKEVEGQLSALAFTEGLASEPVPAVKLAQKLTAANEHNAGLVTLEAARDKVLTAIDDAENDIVTINEQIDKLKSELEIAEKHAVDLREELAEKEKPIIDFVSEDTEAIQAELHDIDATNDIIRENVRYTAAFDKFQAKGKEADDLTIKMDNIEMAKKEATRAADMPIPGLELSAGVVTLDGIPIDQISSSEQIKVGVAISMAMNPTLKVIRIKDGSLLDADSMKIIGDMIKEKDYQLWVEVVGDNAEAGILIEDGLIK